MNDSILFVENLETVLNLDEGVAKVADRVSFSIKRGETLALVGESGCGKTMTAYSILRLIPYPLAQVVGGTINFDGENLLEIPEKKMRNIRGNRISMIFQEPLTSLNPVFRVGIQIAEALEEHRGMKRKTALEKAVGLLREVGIPTPEKVVYSYPHMLSGGMRQRVMIAMALCCEPDLIIADEPTTALDVTVQAQIVEMLSRIKQQHNTAILLITHDLGVVAEVAQNVAVMYAGTIFEYGKASEIFKNPLSPYTEGLLDSLPLFDGNRLKTIKGMVPRLTSLPRGCRFNTRCEKVFERCFEQEPPLLPYKKNGESEKHFVRCWHYN